MIFGRLQSGRTGFSGAVERLVTFWALCGGAVLLLIVAINVIEVTSVVTRAWTGRFAGGAELTSMFAAIAIFSFLPYCQLTGANVTADIFTARFPPRLVAVLKAVASVVAVGFSLLLLWRMYLGMEGRRVEGLSTTILGVPIWPAYAVAVVSLALVAVAALVNIHEHLREAAGKRQN